MVFLSRLLMAEFCKQSLLTLRKSTGHSFQHCKKALQESNNDLKAAQKWLERESLAQGWSKLERSEGRSANEGVLSIVTEKNVTAITEVNCETDFVARNAELRDFVKSISEGLCKESLEQQHQGVKKLSWDEISKMNLGGTTLEESRARLVAKVGEKLSINRSTIINAAEGEKFIAKCHPESAFGKFGAVLFYKGGNDQLADQMCRHVIGMRPTSIGSMEDLEKLKKQREAQAEKDEQLRAEAEKSKQSEEVSETTSENSEDDEEVKEEPENDDERLVLQDFVFKQSMRVGDVLKANEMEITKFWRFECSADTIESKP